MPGDIRSDGRALPLRHRSSRGQIPRNSGNFTRGSQLFATFATVPLAIWFVDYSQRRGRDILAERHEHGAALVDHAVLPDDIVNLPSRHGFATSAEGILRVPKTKKRQGRGGEGASEAKGKAGGRDGAPELVKDDAVEAVTEREILALPAPASNSSLTSTPSDQQDQQATERLDPFAPCSATVEKPASDDKP